MRNIFKKANSPPGVVPAVPHANKNNVTNPGELVTQIAFEQKMAAIDARLNTSNQILLAVIIVLVVCFVTLFYGYWQFTATSYSDYSGKVDQLNKDRYTFLQERINLLQKSQIDKLSSQSATSSSTSATSN